MAASKGIPGTCEANRSIAGRTSTGQIDGAHQTRFRPSISGRLSAYRAAIPETAARSRLLGAKIERRVEWKTVDREAYRSSRIQSRDAVPGERRETSALNGRVGPITYFGPYYRTAITDCSVRPVRRINIRPSHRSSAERPAPGINRRGNGYVIRPRLRPQLNHRCSGSTQKRPTSREIVNRRSARNRIRPDVDTQKSRNLIRSILRFLRSARFRLSAVLSRKPPSGRKNGKTKYTRAGDSEPSENCFIPRDAMAVISQRSWKFPPKAGDSIGLRPAIIFRVTGSDNTLPDKLFGKRLGSITKPRLSHGSGTPRAKSDFHCG